MPLQIVRNDITKMKCDAIVSAATATMQSERGVEYALREAAGEGLIEELSCLSGCGVGQAKITGAYQLPANYVIHTAGPQWKDGKHGEAQSLASCYRSSLELAKKYHCNSIAFPLIASGTYGFPKDLALRIATEVIRLFLRQNEMTVFLVVYDKESFEISKELYCAVESYIDDHYILTHKPALGGLELDVRRKQTEAIRNQGSLSTPTVLVDPRKVSSELWNAQPDSLEKRLMQMDESFSEMLLKKIADSGMTEAQCYKKANVDRKLFSKIRTDPKYKPSKTTALAYLIALELPLEETVQMLKKAGYAFSNSSKADVIVEYFISKKNFDIFEINEALFAFDQPLLGV